MNQMNVGAEEYQFGQKVPHENSLAHAFNPNEVPSFMPSFIQ